MIDFKDYCIVKLLHYEVTQKNLKCEKCPFLDKCKEESEHITVGYKTHRRMIEERDERIKELERERDDWKRAYMKLNALFSEQK